MSIRIDKMGPVRERITVSVPGSKSVTNRALLLAAMAGGKSCIRGCLESDDSRHFIECLKTLGFGLKERAAEAGNIDIEISGTGGDIPEKRAAIDVGSAGTAARFLTAMLALSEGEWEVRSSEQMKRRPMQPLIKSLREAGAEVRCLEEEGCFPMVIKGNAAAAGPFCVNIDESSQFLSALMIAAGAKDREILIKAEGSHGLKYVDMTAELMRKSGASVDKKEREYHVRGPYSPADMDVEPDASAAAYFYALAAVSGGEFLVRGMSRGLMQGDVAFTGILEKMGCTVTQHPEGLAVKGPEGGKLKGGLTADMSEMSDQALTLAAIAPFADGPVAIGGIGHIRKQESDRINSMAVNLKAMGIKYDERPDGITVYPGEPAGCEIKSFGDHRVAMAFAVTALKAGGMSIDDPGCCAKTFPGFFEIINNLLLGGTQ